MVRLLLRKSASLQAQLSWLEMLARSPLSAIGRQKRRVNRFKDKGPSAPIDRDMTGEIQRRKPLLVVHCNARLFAHAKKVADANGRKIDSSASIRHVVVMVGKLGFSRKDFPKGTSHATFFSSELPYPLNEFANMSMLRLAKTAATAHSLHETGLVFAVLCAEFQSTKPVMTCWCVERSGLGPIWKNLDWP